ncbi:hypothetical protein GCM10009602_32340 [Nocardiopsis tropica]
MQCRGILSARAARADPIPPLALHSFHRALDVGHVTRFAVTAEGGRGTGGCERARGTRIRGRGAEGARDRRLRAGARDAHQGARGGGGAGRRGRGEPRPAGAAGGRPGPGRERSGYSDAAV